MSDLRAHVGHNGGPMLDEEENKEPPGPRYCKYCQHWSPPSEWDVRAYEAFQLGLSKRRVKRPSGTCDRVLMQPGKPLAFAATVDTFGCLNFLAKPPAPIMRGRGFVTIYEGDRIVWQGHEEDMPEAYR